MTMLIKWFLVEAVRESSDHGLIYFDVVGAPYEDAIEAECVSWHDLYHIAHQDGGVVALQSTCSTPDYGEVLYILLLLFHI